MIRLSVLLALLYIVLGVSILIYPDVYIVELIISFLPYLLWGGGILLLYISIHILCCSVQLHRKVLIVLFVLSCLFVIKYAWEYNSFYTQVRSEPGESGLSILYGNIRYQNERMDELVDIIDAYSPDMVFFVEYTPDHHSVLYDVLSETYPYINTEYPRSRGPAGKVMYSKYPFENLAPTLEGSAQWKYGYIAMEYEENEYVFYLVHTSAPISPLFFRMRNTQLASLQEAVLSDMSKSHQDSVMTVLGDFNISPWSSAYDKLEASFSLFTNISSYLPGLTTWGYAGSFVRSHIDHIWINAPDLVKTVDLIPLQGSDHDLLYLQLYKK